MEIRSTRADGVVVELDNLDGKKIERDVHRWTFLSWDDIHKLTLERSSYNVIKTVAADQRKKRSK